MANSHASATLTGSIIAPYRAVDDNIPWLPLPEAAFASSILTIDLGAIAHNYGIIKNRVQPAECAAVMKANAYGVGLLKVLPTLKRAGCNWFFVADITEGLHARAIDADVKIGVLGGLPEKTESYFAENNVVPVLNTLDEIRRWAEIARTYNRILPAIIHIDTGMNRLGLSLKDAQALSGQKDLLHNFDIQYWFSHLVHQDKTDLARTKKQYDDFVAAMAHLPQAKASICNGSALFYEAYLGMDMVRAGDVLYGSNPVKDQPNPMRPVFEWRARILEISEIEANDSVGYSAAEYVKRRTRIATVSIGYADGLTRGGSSRAVVYIGGYPAKALGRISMDLTVVDVTDIPEDVLQKHRWAEIMGPNIPLDALAESCSTIPHEILTKLPFRVHRRYIES